jgi:hypothetical protein
MMNWVKVVTEGFWAFELFFAFLVFYIPCLGVMSLAEEAQIDYYVRFILKLNSSSEVWPRLLRQRRKHFALSRLTPQRALLLHDRRTPGIHPFLPSRRALGEMKDQA